MCEGGISAESVAKLLYLNSTELTEKNEKLNLLSWNKCSELSDMQVIDDMVFLGFLQQLHLFIRR